MAAEEHRAHPAVSMTFLVVIATCLATLWLGETIVYLIGFRRESRSSS
jgi:hypothetical protein